MARSCKKRTEQYAGEPTPEPGALSFQMTDEAGTRGVIVTDAEHRIRFTDHRICELLGVEPSALAGRDVEEAIRDILKNRFRDPDEFECRSRRLHKNLAETAEDVMELVVPEHRVLHRYSTPLLDESRRPIGRIEVYSDITKRRRLEEANTALYKQVRSAYEELKTTQEQLLQSEKLRAVGEIAGGVAHDFNNILGIILGNIQLLLRTVNEERVCTRLRAVERAALDGADTVRRIQEFTRIRADEPSNPVDLSALVTSVVDVMRPSWESSMQVRDRRIDVELDLSDGVYALGIAPEIREVLANILLNAVQAMPEGGRIRASTGRSGQSVWVTVADTGIGMTEDVRRRVFDPFFTTKGVEGTGLGMSVAYGIVKRHSGSISIESSPHEGTTVTVFLPSASREPLPAVAGRTKTAAILARILVVDDEEAFAQVFTDMLSERGHAVCVARSGADAIEQFKADPFDLVFTDLGMPEMSGWQVARSIKEMRPGTPVVLLTGWGTKVDEDRLAESKADMVLSKPVEMDELTAVVARMLGAKKGRKGTS